MICSSEGIAALYEAIDRGSFTSVTDLTRRIRAFIDGGNDRCHPFVWTKTAEQILAVWVRARDGVADLSGLVCHHDAGSQYTSIAFTERLAEAGIDPSVGSVGDAYDWPRP